MPKWSTRCYSRHWAVGLARIAVSYGCLVAGSPSLAAASLLTGCSEWRARLPRGVVHSRPRRRLAERAPTPQLHHVDCLRIEGKPIAVILIVTYKREMEHSKSHNKQGTEFPVCAIPPVIYSRPLFSYVVYERRLGERQSRTYTCVALRRPLQPHATRICSATHIY